MKQHLIGFLAMALVAPAFAATPFPLAMPAGGTSSGPSIGLLSLTASAQDAGRVTHFYIAGDALAVHLDGGFPNARAAGVCSSSVGESYWAGSVVADKAVVAALMSAKVSGARVQITTSGCDNNGAWLKIADVYLVD